ncbi:Uncharacterised protein [BD1-7 clade bacterium]|uniref:D-inositol-3-phosphate glycosyltransferase n=1 Tax=BD1-7 clade bacterium TaxID=2029982 RepID=A0A5S9MS65_9GAMM|nr:Uncharacterised protein [BD1-7 clade bacterium]
MNILLFSKYSRQGASSRLRSLQYLPMMNADGFSVEVSPLFDDEYLKKLYDTKSRSKYSIVIAYLSRFRHVLMARKYDLIWIEYELFPYFPAFFERILRLLGVRYVVDYDDAIFHNYDLSSSVLVRKILGEKIDKVMESSCCVVVGNNYLKERAQTSGAQNIEYFPTVVDADRYLPSAPKVGGGELVIGWIGSPSTQKYVLKLKDVIAKFCQPGVARLVMVGASRDVLSDLSGLNVSVEPWAEDTEASLVSRFDIGIMPLEDGPWERGKCGYKLIQYMASGKPVIASPIGVNTKLVTESEVGLLASSLEDWQSALMELIGSPELRKQYGENGRKAVEQQYSIQAQAPRLIRIFKEL